MTNQQYKSLLGLQINFLQASILLQTKYQEQVKAHIEAAGLMKDFMAMNVLNGLKSLDGSVNDLKKSLIEAKEQYDSIEIYGEEE